MSSKYTNILIASFLLSLVHIGLIIDDLMPDMIIPSVIGGTLGYVIVLAIVLYILKLVQKYFI